MKVPQKGGPTTFYSPFYMSCAKRYICNTQLHFYLVPYINGPSVQSIALRMRPWGTCKPPCTEGLRCLWNHFKSPLLCILLCRFFFLSMVLYCYFSSFLFSFLWEKDLKIFLIFQWKVNLKNKCTSMLVVCMSGPRRIKTSVSYIWRANFQSWAFLS